MALLVSLSQLSWAQVDLLGVASGRYQVKKSNTASSTTNAMAPSKKSPTKVDRKIASDSEAVQTVQSEQSKKDKASVQADSDETTNAPEEPGIAEHAKSLMSANAENIINFYKEQVHPDDIRNNKVEIEIRPGVFYNDSKSNYSYRTYQSFYTGLNVYSNVWVTPLIGFYGKLGFSLAANVSGVSSTLSKTPVKFESVDLGFKFRKFFGLSRKSNSVEFDVVMVDDKMTVPPDDVSRARLRTSGMGLALSTRLPTSANHAWVLGTSFFPRLQHGEIQAGSAISSGSPSETTRIGFDAGGELKFSRESQIVYKFNVSSERNTFSGAAGLTDPESGTTPSNVGVTNTLLGFSFGYRWAN